MKKDKITIENLNIIRELVLSTLTIEEKEKHKNIIEGSFNVIINELKNNRISI